MMLTRWMLIAVSGVGLTAGLMTSGVQAAPYGTAGCGLGSLVFHDDPGFMQVVGATLNFTGLQTFGISTGTSNCGANAGNAPSRGKKGKKEKPPKDEDKDAANDLKVNDFIVANLATLKVESARGHGDSLTALSVLLGCDGQQLTTRTFGSMTQDKHAALDAQPDAAGIKSVLVEGLRDNPTLAQRCGTPS